MTDAPRPSEPAGPAGGLRPALRAIRWVLWKDLAVFFADRQGALLTIVTPVLLASLIGSIFAPRDDSGRIPLLVVDEAPTDASRALTARLQGHRSIDVEAASAADARDRLEHGKATAALVLPADWERAASWSNVLSDGIRLELWVDPARETEAGILGGLLTEVVFQELIDSAMNAETLRRELGSMRTALAAAKARGSVDGRWLPTVDLALSTIDTSSADTSSAPKPDSERSAGAGFAPVQVATVPILSQGVTSGYNSYAHNFAGMLAMFLLFMAADRARSWVDERTQGTLSRMRLAPCPPKAALVGFASATTVIALLLSAAVFGAGILAFGVPILGSSAGFAAMIASQALFAAGFGLLLAGLARTGAQIGNISVFVILIASFAGGVWMPAFLLPDWLHSAGALLPTRWVMDGFAAVTWRGLSGAAVWLPAAQLAAAGVLAGAIGMWRFRW